MNAERSRLKLLGFSSSFRGQSKFSFEEEEGIRVDGGWRLGKETLNFLHFLL